MISAGSRPMAAQWSSSDGAFAAEVRGGEGGARPDVGVLGHDPKTVPFAARPDHDRRMRALDRLRLADRAGEPVAAPGEVERLLLAPQPLDQRAGFGEGGQRLAGRHHVDSEWVELSVHELRVSRILGGAAARADPEDQPPGRDDVDGGRHLGEHGRRPNPVTGDDHPQRSRLVCAASAASSVQASRAAPVTSPRSGTR